MEGTLRLGRRRGVTSVRRAAAAVAGGLFGVVMAAVLVAPIAVLFLDYSVVTLQSGSMQPTYSKGDIVVVRPESMSKLKEGDIIQFTEQNTGVPFIHRVVGVNSVTQELRDGETDELLGRRTEYRVVTKGDANPFNDQNSTTAENYRGEVWFSLPTAAVFGSSFTPTMGLVAFAALIGVAWVAWEVGTRVLRRGAAGEASSAPGD
jgi:signal peptidase I